MITDGARCAAPGPSAEVHRRGTVQPATQRRVARPLAPWRAAVPPCRARRGTRSPPPTAGRRRRRGQRGTSTRYSSSPAARARASAARYVSLPPTAPGERRRRDPGAIAGPAISRRARGLGGPVAGLLAQLRGGCRCWGTTCWIARTARGGAGQRLGTSRPTAAMQAAWAARVASALPSSALLRKLMRWYVRPLADQRAFNGCGAAADRRPRGPHRAAGGEPGEDDAPTEVAPLRDRERAERLWAVSVDRLPPSRSWLRRPLQRAFAHLARPLWDDQRAFNDVVLKLVDDLHAQLEDAVDPRRVSARRSGSCRRSSAAARRRRRPSAPASIGPAPAAFGFHLRLRVAHARVDRGCPCQTGRLRGRLPRRRRPGARRGLRARRVPRPAPRSRHRRVRGGRRRGHGFAFAVGEGLPASNTATCSTSTPRAGQPRRPLRRAAPWSISRRTRWCVFLAARRREAPARRAARRRDDQPALAGRAPSADLALQPLVPETPGRPCARRRVPWRPTCASSTSRPRRSGYGRSSCTSDTAFDEARRALADVARTNDLLFGPLDYALVARR